MGVPVQIDGIGAVELDDSFRAKAPAEQQSIIDGIKSQHAQMQPPRDTSQPSLIDRAIASPPVTAIHDVAANGLAGMANMGARALDVFAPGMGLGLMAPLTQQATQIADQPYQGALDRNRNTPGYAAARAKADTVQQRRGGAGFEDSMLAPFLPTLAGTAGLAGGLDMSNAMRDAQTQSQGQYAADHPFLSMGAGLFGGMLAGPSGLADAVPAYASDNAFMTRMGKGPNLMGPLPQKPPMPAAVDPATSYVQRVMGNVTPQDLINFDTKGKPIMAAEAIGKPGEVAIGALARRDGATADSLLGNVRVRSASAPDRIASDWASATGIHPDAARGDIEAFIASNERAADPLYTAAKAANQNMSSPAIDAELARPAGRKAMREAATNMQNDGVLMGVRDPDLLEQARDSGQEIPWKGGVSSGLKLQSLDYIKRALDAQINTAIRAGDTAASGPLMGLKNRLVKAIDDADVTASAGPNSTKPEGGLYAQARAKAGEYLSAKKQFSQGQQDILNTGLQAKDFADYFAKLGPADQQAYLGGAANKLFNLQQQGKLSAAVFKAPMVEGKLAAAIGPEKARAFIQNMASEQKMADFARTRVPGAGSPTAEYNAAMAEQDGGNAGINFALDAGQNVINHGPIRGAIKTGVQYLKNPIANFRAGVMPVPVRDAAGALLQLPPADLGLHLQSLPKLLTPSNGVPKRIPLGAFLLPQQSPPQR